MPEEKVLTNATLCFLMKNRKVLLAIKTKGIGKGRWNGYGGGIEPGERPKEAAPRELFEESGLIAESGDLNKVAIVDFHNTKSDGGEFVCQVHVYFLYKWIGEPKTTDEMIDPTWFDLENLPFDDMVLADWQWMSHILKGKKIRAKAHLGPFQRTLLSEVEITEVDSFPDE